MFCKRPKFNVSHVKTQRNSNINFGKSLIGRPAMTTFLKIVINSEYRYVGHMIHTCPTILKCHEKAIFHIVIDYIAICSVWAWTQTPDWDAINTTVFLLIISESILIYCRSKYSIWSRSRKNSVMYLRTFPLHGRCSTCVDTSKRTLSNRKNLIPGYI